MLLSRLRNLQGWLRYPAAVLVVVASTLVAEVLYRVLETTRLSMIFLAGVVISAVWLGSGPAFLTAALAFVVYNFYLVDPRFTIQFATAEDFIVLSVFLIVAMLTGALAGRVRDGARESDQRARTTGVLLSASRSFSEVGDEPNLRTLLAQRLAEAAGGAAVVWDGATTERSHPGRTPPDTLLEDAFAAAAGIRDPSLTLRHEGPWTARAIRTSEATYGVAAWMSGGEARSGSHEAPLIDVLIDMAATAISRARLAKAQSEAESLARTERLRNALLASVSHDFRTPLAAIIASASSLRTYGQRFDEATRDDLSSTIQEEAERLNAYVGNMLNFTRLEGGALETHPSPVDPWEVLDRLTSRLAPRKGARRLEMNRVGTAIRAHADPILLEQALGNILENAIRYSPDGSEIAVSVEARDVVRIDIGDEGPGVPAHELESIFDKFYTTQDGRGPGAGTGLGLSIAKGFVEAMGGRVWAEPRRDCTGLNVVVELLLAGRST